MPSFSALLLATLQAAPAPNQGGGAAPEATLSYLVTPLFLGEEPPEVRTVAHIQVVHAGVERARGVSRTREAAEALAREIHAQLAAGADFVGLAALRSEAPDAKRGAVLGTFPRGLLAPELDEFLFSAEVGAFSAPIENAQGFHILQRVETRAGARQILVRDRGPDGQARARKIHQRLLGGEDFAALALELSDDPFSKTWGGQLSVFERGPDDVLVKAAVFAAEVGELIGPIETPLGLHIVQRVPVESIDPALHETSWARARAILIAYDGADAAPPSVTRTFDEARELALDLERRLREGEDMAALAREHDDDFKGRERAGDLGWIHRRSPKMARFLERLWLEQPGHLFEPLVSNAGFVVLKRER